VQLPESIARIDNGRTSVRNKLAGQGIATGLYFPPLHQQPAWHAGGGTADLRLPVTERVASRTLALPFFTRIASDTQRFVANALLAALRSV
jgi:perosamine synthetase